LIFAADLFLFQRPTKKRVLTQKPFQCLFLPPPSAATFVSADWLKESHILADANFEAFIVVCALVAFYAELCVH
jgi:hypothetical protein